MRSARFDLHSDRARILGWTVLAGVVGLRLLLCFQVPLTTTDAYRNLGYGAHAFDREPPVYRSVAGDYAPERWAAIWSNQGFPYGPVTLVFFYLFSPLGLGIFWVKLVLTLLELVVAGILAHRVSLGAGLLALSAPVSLYFVSHEGEFEPLQSLWIALTIVQIQKGRWRAAGVFFALSAQTKAFGVLLLPWIGREWWESSERRRHGTDFLLGGVAGTLPFAFFYGQDPLLLLTPLVHGIPASYNPFAWKTWDPGRFLWNPSWLVAWNAVFSGASLAVALAFTWVHRRERDGWSLVPVAAFWLVSKSLQWGQFWYPLVLPALLLCLGHRRRPWIIALLVLHLLQGGRSASVLAWGPTGWVESPRHRRQMQACLFRCSLSLEPARRRKLLERAKRRAEAESLGEEPPASDARAGPTQFTDERRREATKST